ncbi:MAG: hypothetical protein IBJ12_07330 [Sphingomonadaceae bacterium]|nr:hypothetical protein [Sphingomonadaceae bacterium]
MQKDVELKDRPNETAHGGHGGDGRDKTFEIAIIYNGVEKKVEVDRDELVSSVLAKAIRAHQITENVHALGLFPEEGPELDISQTVKDAKIKKRDRVLLRPSTVRAG